MEKKKLVIFGCGKLAGTVVDAYNDGLLTDYQIVGACSKSNEDAQNLLDRIDSTNINGSDKVCEDIDEIIEAQPDIVIETSNPDAFKDMALPVLESGISIITLSIGALADDIFKQSITSACDKSGAKVHVASGAIGGFDVLKTTTLMGGSKTSMKTTKGPNSLKGTPVYEEELQENKKKVFEGNAQKAINMFPTRINVAIAASLASEGPEEMEFSITSVPNYVGDDHRI